MTDKIKMKIQNNHLFHLSPIKRLKDIKQHYVHNRTGIDRQFAYIASYISNGNSIYILGLPGVGKTSFLHYICYTLTRENNIVFVYIDIIDYFLRWETGGFSEYIFDKIKQSEKFEDFKSTELIGLLREIHDFNSGDGRGNYFESEDRPENDPVKLVIVMDHIDTVNLEILKNCTRTQLEDFQIVIQKLKCYCPEMRFPIICCGNRHYHIAREEMKIFVEEKKKYADQSEYLALKDKLESYLKILRTSIYKMDIYYLQGFNAPEIRDLCKKLRPRVQGETLDKLVHLIIEKIGGHPKMVVNLLNRLDLDLETFKGDLKNRLTQVVENAITQLLPTYENIFNSIWHNLGLEADRDFLCRIAKNEIITSGVINELARMKNEPGFEPMIRNKAETYESQGLFISLDMEAEDANKRLKFFSELFRRHINGKICSEEQPESAHQDKVSITFSEKGVQLSKGDYTTKITGKAHEFFHYLFERRGGLVAHNELLTTLFDVKTADTENLNRLYQIKSNVSGKIEPVPEIQLKSVSGEGYCLEIEDSADIQIIT